MSDGKARTHWGTSRRTVRLLIDRIETEISAGNTLTDIYKRYQDQLVVAYSSFVRMVNQEMSLREQTASDSAVARRDRPVRWKPLNGAAVAPQTSSNPSTGGTPRPPVETPLPPRGSKEWNKLHGIPERKDNEPAFVARVPDIEFLFRPADPKKEE